MNIVNMWVMTMITIAILDELLLWMRCFQLRPEAREAMNRLIEVLEPQNNEHMIVRYCSSNYQRPLDTQPVKLEDYLICFREFLVTLWALLTIYLPSGSWNTT